MINGSMFVELYFTFEDELEDDAYNDELLVDPDTDEPDDPECEDEEEWDEEDEWEELEEEWDELEDELAGGGV